MAGKLTEETGAPPLLSLVSHRIDPTQRLVLTVLAGEISFKQSVAFLEMLSKDPAFDSTYNELVDMLRMTGTTVTSDEMRRLGETSLFAATSKRAFVTKSSLIFGLTRMYEAHCGQHDGASMRIFGSMDEACAWLGVKVNSSELAQRAP